jgi:hypothetical protein
MRLTTIGAALVVAGCAGTQTADITQAAKRACGGISCFYEREIRDFEVINHTTLIVYVGAERCPYQVELLGTFCDMEFAPELYFTSPTQAANTGGASRAADAVTPASRTTVPIDPRSPERNLSDLRICANDISIGVSGGSFTNDPANTSGKTACQIQSVASLTDDKLIELYVRKGVVPPPPPMGSGTIQVGAQSTPSPSGGGGAAGGSQGSPAQGAQPASHLRDSGRD